MKWVSWGLLTWVGVGLSMAACADALRLEPPPGGQGGAGNTAGNATGGGGGSIPCASSSDCPEPTSVCDTVLGFCVECLELEDCGHMPSTVCSEGSCVCAGGLTYCEPGLCADAMTSPAHCGTCDHACFGSCVDGACADPWEPVSTVGAPSARAKHVSVWTGTHLFVWGGSTAAGAGSNVRTGGLYDPATSTWTPTVATHVGHTQGSHATPGA